MKNLTLKATAFFSVSIAGFEMYAGKGSVKHWHCDIFAPSYKSNQNVFFLINIEEAFIQKQSSRGAVKSSLRKLFEVLRTLCILEHLRWLALFLLFIIICYDHANQVVSPRYVRNFEYNKRGQAFLYTVMSGSKIWNDEKRRCNKVLYYLSPDGCCTEFDIYFFEVISFLRY